jgi:hypothetical protein
MEAVCSPETLVNICQTTPRHITEDRSLNIDCRENLTFLTVERTFGIIKGVDFFEQLRNYCLLKRRLLRGVC